MLDNNTKMVKGFSAPKSTGVAAIKRFTVPGQVPP
jgi:hypothetical protein